MKQNSAPRVRVRVIRVCEFMYVCTVLLLTTPLFKKSHQQTVTQVTNTSRFIWQLFNFK
jgi:hypothetical protein